VAASSGECWKQESVNKWKDPDKSTIGTALINCLEHSIFIQAHIKETKSVCEGDYADDIEGVATNAQGL
jgi:hypothetical protein